MMKAKSRELHLDGIKVFALLLVFALHTQRAGEVTAPCHNAALFYAARCSMPLFFMVNGALILRKESFSFAYYRKKLLGIFRILAIWSVITGLYYLLFYQAGLVQSIKEGLKSMLAYHHIINLWFFITFALIYTLLLWGLPLIKKHLKPLLLALGAICVLIDLGSLISIANGGFFLQEAVTQRLRLWTWLFYFCLGYYLNTLDLSRFKPAFIHIAAVLLTILCTIYQYVLCFLITGQIESNYVYDSPLVILWSAALFLSFRCAPRLSSLFARFVGPSFGAFLMHSYIVDALQMRQLVSGPVQSTLGWILLIITTWSISWLFGKIPVVKEAFRY